jgi:transcriptional regulator with XRE-family HTH domain
MTKLQRVIKVSDWLIFETIVKNRRDLAEKMGYTESSFSQILNGKVNLSDRFIKKLAKMDERLNSEWLLIGEGSMLRETPSIKQKITGSGNTTIGNAGNVDLRKYNSDSPDVLRAQIDEKDRLLNEKEERIKEKDAQIKEKDAQINKLLDIIQNTNH